MNTQKNPHCKYSLTVCEVLHHNAVVEQDPDLCGVQVLTTDFDFAMAGRGQNGKCKLDAGHDGNHDVRNR